MHAGYHQAQCAGEFVLRFDTVENLAPIVR